MPYDAEKDKEIDKREIEIDGTKYVISLKSYDGAEAKVAISLASGRFPVKRLTPKHLVAIANSIADWAAK